MASSEQTRSATVGRTPPCVVYSFQSIPERNWSMTRVERLTFLCSLLTARFHFGNATIVGDAHSLLVLKPFQAFATQTVLVDEADSQQLPVFWGTICKLIGLKWAKCQPYTSQLLLDADAVIWQPQTIEWENPLLNFVGGYREPLSWEAYREQGERLGLVFAYAISKATNREVNIKNALAPHPVNGGILYFSEDMLLQQYLTAMDAFVEKFYSDKYAARPFFNIQGDPASGSTYFSEGMMADQRTIGYLVDQMYMLPGGTCSPRCRFLGSFENAFCSYPMPSTRFFHLWKAKKVCLPNTPVSAAVEQYLLRSLRETVPADFLEACGITIVTKSPPMVDNLEYLELVFHAPLPAGSPI